MIRHTYTSIVRNSIRQIWRKKAFWVITGVLSLAPLLISVIVYLVNPDSPVAPGVGAPGVFTLSLNYLVLPFLVAPAILDDFGKVGEILWSGPLDNLVYFAGRFSGLWLALAAGSLVQLTAWFLASLVWLNLLTEWVWLLSLAIYLLANTLGLSLVFLLAVLFRRNLPLMLTWAALWVGMYYSVIFGAALAESFTPMISMAFTNIFFHNLSLSPSLGLGLVRGQLLGMFAWFFGVSLAALSLALLLTALLDERRSTRLGWLMPTLAGAALLAAVGGYAVNARATAAHAVPVSPQDVQVDAWEVQRQHTVLQVDARSGRISGEAEMVFAPVEELKKAELVLRLNAGLELTALSGESGDALEAQRVGDSVVIQLPAAPQAPIILKLSWAGRLQIPYTAFEQQWRWHDAPGDYGYRSMPQALYGLVQSNGGFLLRDGDWMPWIWTTSPHLAAENTLEIHPRGGRAVASTPLQDGAAVWQGSIPEGLLVFLPGKQISAGYSTLVISRLAGTQHQAQARRYASAAQVVAEQFEIPAPRYVVVLPYLNKLVWSGDLLLIPDGSGQYINISLIWLYYHDATNPRKQPYLERAALHNLARLYLLNQAPPAPLAVKALLAHEGQELEVVNPIPVSSENWLAGSGRWVQAPEAFDYDTLWSPRRWILPTEQGEWSAVAFWLALELSDSQTRQGDLDGLAFFNASHPNDDRSARNDLLVERIWSQLLDSTRARDIVLRLHALSDQLGAQQTIALLRSLIQENHPETVTELLDQMEQHQNNEVQP